MDIDYNIKCAFCNFTNDISENVCINCGTQFPDTINVRRASLPIETNALNERYNNAKAYLKKNKLTNEGNLLEEEAKINGKAVINTSFTFLWEWLFHNKFSYESYRRQLINGTRLKAKFKDDKKRSIIDSILFGSENDIIYAALSIDGSGLSSYGDITIILKNFSIEKRTSCLEKNSYLFINECVSQGWKIDDPIPPGHICTWPNRHKLLLAKLHKDVKQGLSSKQLSLLVLNSNENRATDEFVELYIWGKIISSAIEQIRIPQALINEFGLKENLMLNELKSKFNVNIY